MGHAAQEEELTYGESQDNNNFIDVQEEEECVSNENMGYAIVFKVAEECEE